MAGIQDFLRNNSSALLQGGVGLLGGRTASEQAAGGFQGFGNARQQTVQRNQTIEYLKRVNPELAEAVQMGNMAPTSALDAAYRQKLEAEKPKKPNMSFQTLPNGQYGFADMDNGTFNPLGTATRPNTGPLADLEERKKAAAAAGLSEGDPTYQGFILTGKMPREDAQTLTPTDKKALWAAEDEVPALDNTISSLKRAKELNRKTFTGVTAGARGFLGTAVPGGDYLVDGEAAKATSEFNKTMSLEAIQSMAQTLKGATTDAELARFVDILADPATDPDIRERTIDRMTALAERVREVKNNRINELRGTPKGAPGAGNAGRATSTGVKWSVEP